MTVKCLPSLNKVIYFYLFSIHLTWLPILHWPESCQHINQLGRHRLTIHLGLLISVSRHSLQRYNKFQSMTVKCLPLLNKVIYFYLFSIHLIWLSILHWPESCQHINQLSRHRLTIHFGLLISASCHSLQRYNKF